VPKFLPDEHIFSWISRLAARYDMDAPALLQEVTRGEGISRGEISLALDKPSVEFALETLAKRSGADSQILRLMLPSDRAQPLVDAADQPEAAAWCRGWSGWCPDCARDDITERGEVFGRRAWYSRQYLVCERHQTLLTDHCPRCARQTVEPKPVGGRLRLVCRVCAAPIEGHPQREHLALDSLSVLHLGGTAREHLIAFQADLCRALAGADCNGPWRYGSSAAEFIGVVVDLCLAFVGPPLGNWRSKTLALSGMGVSEGAAGLAAAASVLSWLNGIDIGVYYTASFPVPGIFPLRLAELLRHMSYAERVWLHSRREGKDDRLWREWQRTGATFVPSGGITGEPMAAWSVMMLTSMRAKEFIRAQRSSRVRRSHRRTTPKSIVAGLIHTMGLELAGRDVPQPVTREHPVSGHAYTTMIEADVNALVQCTLRECGDEPVQAVLHRPCRYARLHPGENPPAGYEIVHYLQGRRRRTLLAALIRASLLDARSPQEERGLTLEPDEFYLRNLR
jgi:hypothetical protein